MKKTALLLLMLVSTTAMAECYMRVSTNLSKQAVNSRPVDIQQLVTPDDAGQKCVLRYRIHIGDDWQTIEGEGIGATETQACAQAIKPDHAAFLEDLDSDTVTADSQMVCSDLPEIRVRPVRVGDNVWESETELHIYKSERPYFTYKGAKCRLFVERDNKDQNLMLYQGIICKLDAVKNSKWRVVDKY